MSQSLLCNHQLLNNPKINKKLNIRGVSDELNIQYGILFCNKRKQTIKAYEIFVISASSRAIQMFYI